jgi:UDPglucose 6-dehydrogenase
MNKRLTIFGLGYVGCSMSVLLAQKNQVIAIDIDSTRVEAINNRKSPIQDQMTEDFLKNKDLILSATSDLESSNDSDYFIIATPTNYDEESNYFDTSSVRECIKKIKLHNKLTPIIIKSTIPVGFVDELNAEHSCNNIMFSPEFLREGTALYDNLNPSRIIIGNSSEKAKVFVSLLEEASQKNTIPTFFTGTKEAESIKLFANAYLALRVSFFNELDTYGQANDLDVESIIKGISSDDRIGNFYNNPSFGYGGYCLPKDTKQLLANFKNIPQNIISAIVDSNETRKDFLSKEIIKNQPSLVGIYLLSMKAGSDNYRSSAIQGIISNLKNTGIKVCIYEPSYPDNFFTGDIEIIQDLQKFKSISDIIVANRVDLHLEDVKNKVFTRDLFGNN